MSSSVLERWPIQSIVTAPVEPSIVQPPSDPYCDPQNPVTIGFDEIIEAGIRLNGSVQRTPCTHSEKIFKQLGITVYFKNEYQQATKSFKERGARNALLRLSKRQRLNGVISASSGNHALAIAYHGRELGIPVTVCMPIVAPATKVEKCQELGAAVLVHGANINESKTYALGIAREKDMTYVSGFDHPDVLAGQGTVALEVLEQVEDIDAIVLPVGGGGLIAGASLAIKTLCPNVAVIGVETELCPSYQRALLAGRPVNTICGKSLADGLSVPVVGVNSLHTAAGLIDKMVTVNEAQIEQAIALIYHYENAVVEGAGAVTLAALLGNRLPELAGKRVVCLLSGGNIDGKVLEQVLGRVARRG